MSIEISCLLTAILFTAGNVLRIVFLSQEHKRPHFDIVAYKSLDPEYLQSEWNYRLDSVALFFASGFVNATAWLIFAIPLIQMGLLLSRRGKQSLMLNVSIVLLALGGAMTEWLANMLWLGMCLVTKQVVEKYNLENWLRDDLQDIDDATQPFDDGLGWRTVEVNQIVGSGFVWFVDSIEWVFLALIFFTSFLSVSQFRKKDTTTFSGRWNGLGLFISLLSLLDFITEVLRFDGFRAFGPIALIYAAINRILLIPIWILGLGIMLRRATAKLEMDENPIAAELALSELSSAVDANNSAAASATAALSAFSIGDDDDDGSSNRQMSVPSSTSSLSPPPEAFPPTTTNGVSGVPSS